MQENDYIYQPFSEGESYEDLRNHIATFIDFLKQNYDDNYIAIVEHKASQLTFDILLKGKM